MQEYPGYDQPGDISGQDRLTARLGAKSAEPEQDDQQQLDLRLGDPVTEIPDRQPEQPGENQDRPRADGDENDESVGQDHGVAGRSWSTPSTMTSTFSSKKATRFSIFGASGIGAG